jgi:hypothetical protein
MLRRAGSVWPFSQLVVAQKRCEGGGREGLIKPVARITVVHGVVLAVRCALRCVDER